MIFVLVILWVVSRFGRASDTRSDFYTGERAFTAPQNGLALFGAFLGVTSLLSLSGGIAVDGYDGLLTAVGFSVSWLVALLLLAERVRNTGTYTLGDALAVRMRDRPARVAAATVTLVVFFGYMTVQLAGAGDLLALLLNVTNPLGRAAVVVTIGSVVAVIVYCGGMRGTTWTQMIKAALVLAAVVMLAGAVLVRYGFNVSALVSDAAERAASRGVRLWVPGASSGPGLHRLEFVSHVLTVVLGHAALPWLCARLLTVPSSQHARRSVAWVTWLSVPFCLCVVLIGIGAAAVLGPQRILSAPGQRLAATPLLASELGGTVLFAFTASVITTTIIAVSAGLMITAATGFARDIYATVVRREPLDEKREIAVAKRAVVVLCALTCGCAVLLMNRDVEFLLSLSLTVAASSILPTLVLSWFWRAFNTAGALWSMYGGTVATIVLVAFTPWRHVGLVAVPVAFLLGYVGAKCSAERDYPKYAEMAVRSLTGAAVPARREGSG